MKYNRSEIMKRAWNLYRGFSRNLRGEVMGTFANALHLAWTLTKREAAMTIADIKEKMFILNMKDRWDSEDHALALRLRQRIAEAA